MEKLMLTNIQAGDEELCQLASRRANAVKDALLQSGKVEAERMFIVEPKGLTPEKKDKVRDSRVEFKIA
jgi:outer membrane protein OmpA-like peptidoglycan-associated protein